MEKPNDSASVSDVQSEYRGALPEIRATSMNEAERLWLDAEIDKGMASPRITDRTAREIMAEIRTKNRARRG